MRIKSLTVEEMTYFHNFLLQLASTMERVPDTKKKLKQLAKKYEPPREYLNLKADAILASLGLINTAVTSIRQSAEKGIADKTQADHLEKVIIILQTIQEKLTEALPK